MGCRIMSHEITDEEWSIIEPVFPEPKKKAGEKGYLCTAIEICSMVYYGYYGQEHRGKILQVSIIIRYEFHALNYLSMVMFGCIIILLRQF